MGLLGSFGTVGDCFDNAAMESFWARFQVELLNTRKCTATIELAVAMADCIDNFHNERVRNALDVHLFDPSTRITTARNGGDRSAGLIHTEHATRTPPEDDWLPALTLRTGAGYRPCTAMAR